MGREVRKVPGNWEHPKNEKGHYIPLLGRSFKNAVREWKSGKRQWDNGLRTDYEGNLKPVEEKYKSLSYSEWAGEKPVKSDYMPEWSESEKTHLMMYEDTTEGTPISPAFETPEDLAHWLADNNASAFAGNGASYEAWLSTIKRGWAPSAVINMIDGILRSGVEAL